MDAYARAAVFAAAQAAEKRYSDVRDRPCLFAAAQAAEKFPAASLPN